MIFNVVEEAYLYFERFNGEMSPRIRSMKLEIGKTVAVLIFNRSKVIELMLAEALAKIKAGEIVDAKTILGIYWLKNRQKQSKCAHKKEE